MQKITTSSELKNLIIELEVKQELQGKALKEQFYVTYESFNSINLIKTIFSEMTISWGLMNNIVKTMLGLINRDSTSQSQEGSSASMIKSIIRSIIKAGVTNFIIQYQYEIRTFAQYLVKLIFQKKKDKPVESE